MEGAVPGDGWTFVPGRRALFADQRQAAAVNDAIAGNIGRINGSGHLQEPWWRATD